VIVNPRFQGKKLGRDLLQKALSIAPDEDFVLALISTERGKRMYEQAGFVEIGNTHKFIADLPKSEIENNRVRKYGDDDFERVLQLDSQVTGYQRTKLLRERIRMANAVLVFENEKQDMLGFVIVSTDGNRQLIGPIVASTPEVASSLISSTISSGGLFRLDIPHWQNEFIREVASLNFNLERICPLMTFQGRPLPIASDGYFAIMAQALG
jgi:hypothetical protein